MEPAKKLFRERLERFQAKPLKIPVFSPILDRYYEHDDCLAECLANHLVRPVHFCHGVEKLYAEGARTFIEAGALDALTKLVAKTLSDKQIRAVAVLMRSSDELAAFRSCMAVLRPEEDRRCTAAPQTILDNIPSTEAEPFWAEHGLAIEQFVRNEYELFCAKRSVVTSDMAEYLSTGSNSSIQASSSQKAQDVTSVNRTELMQEIVTMYAEALEYPEEVFTESVELEADLGIDSVKQVEMIARISSKYNLPDRPADFRLSNYATIGKVTSFVMAALLRKSTSRIEQSSDCRSHVRRNRIEVWPTRHPS
jgi:acyl transferase domain-containing protein